MAENETALAAGNLPYAEELYASWVRDPASVSEEWRRLFKATSNGSTSARLRPAFRVSSIFQSPAATKARDGSSNEELRQANLQDRVNQLIRNYRVRGHMVARIDPLGQPRP